MSTTKLDDILPKPASVLDKARNLLEVFKAWVNLNSSNLTAGQQLAVKYFCVAIILFVAQILFGLLSALQFIYPDFLYGILNFNVNRMVHINTMIVWMLYGFIGSIYWLIEDESAPILLV